MSLLQGSENNTQIPINFNFRFSLRGRLTLGRFYHTLENLGFSAMADNCPVGPAIFATHVSIVTSDTSTSYHYEDSTAYRTFCYHRNFIQFLSLVSVIHFSPIHLRCSTSARPTSCYAFFKGWLLLSLPTGCLECTASFFT